jgi:hypothetical protein
MPVPSIGLSGRPTKSSRLEYIASGQHPLDGAPSTGSCLHARDATSSASCTLNFHGRLYNVYTTCTAFSVSSELFSTRPDSLQGVWSGLETVVSARFLAPMLVRPQPLGVLANQRPLEFASILPESREFTRNAACTLYNLIWFHCKPITVVTLVSMVTKYLCAKGSNPNQIPL